jgi:hypothetical protein
MENKEVGLRSEQTQHYEFVDEHYLNDQLRELQNMLAEEDIYKDNISETTAYPPKHMACIDELSKDVNEIIQGDRTHDKYEEGEYEDDDKTTNNRN